jgi:phage-related protein
MAITIPLITEFKDRGLKDAETAFDRFNTKAKKAFGGLLDLTKKVAVGAGALAGAAGVGAFKAVEAASDLSEELAKAGELFGDTANEVDAFAKTAAKAFGQSRTQAVAAANQFALFGRAAGLAGQDLIGFSTDFVGLASDLASFNNSTPQEAIDAIGAALRGEAEPLRKFGVLLDDATLKNKALEMGIYDGNGALDQRQKILAAEQVIYEQTSAAQGDFARTSDGLANQQRILRAELANVVTQVGEKLLPVALKLAQFFNDKVIPAVQAVADAFSSNGLAGVFDLVLGVIRDKGPQIRDAIINFLSAAADWILNTGIPRLLDLMRRAGDALVAWIKPRIVPMLRALGDFIAEAANWLINEGLPKLVDTLIKLGDALVAWIKPRIVPVLLALGELLMNILNWILTEALPKITAQLLKLANALVKWIIDVTPEVIKALVLLGANITKWFVTDAIPAVARLAVQLGRGIVNGIGEGLSQLLSKLVEFGQSIVRRIVDGIRSVAGEIGSAILGAIPGAGAIAGAAGRVGGVISKVWPFAEGGIVTAPTMGLVGEAGPEAIIPLDRFREFQQGGRGDINITVTSADPQAVVEAIRSYNRTQGPAPIKVA